MSKTRKNQAGFSIVEIILALVVVAIIGVIGFVVYQNMAKTPTSDTTNKSAATTSKLAVVIPEWGVKLEFDDADKVTYVMSTDNSGKQYANLYLKDSVATVCRALGVGFSRDTTNSDGSTKVGDYYYQLGGGPGACNDDPGGVNGSINQLRQKIDSDELGGGKYTMTAAQ